MSKSATENERIVNATIDIPSPTEQQQGEQEQEQGEQKIEIPASQYTNLINANLQSHLNTLNTLDCFDKFISSLINLQAYAMNMKEDIKKQQLGFNKPAAAPATSENNQQQQQKSTTDRANAQ